MHVINGLMFGLVCLVGDIGCLLLWACIWFPIAASIKIEFNAANLGRYMTKDKVQTISIEGGGSIKVSSQSDSSSELAVGMSMGEP
tara:strand:+ start:148 stop:405 length:258 start_codon:yes stop_codon:yes gene_type:complete